MAPCARLAGRRNGTLVLVLVTLLGMAYAEDATRSIDLGTVQLHILSSIGDKLISSKGTYPSKLLSSPQITSSQAIEVSLKVTAEGKAFKPQQVFLALQRTADGAVAYAVGKASKKDGGLVISAPASTIAAQIGNQGGVYQVSLYVGDVSVGSGVSWALGDVELVVDASEPPGNKPLRTTKLQPVNNQLPVIQHMFRPAEKRPPATVSLAFAALAFVPLLVTIIYLFTGVGVNFNAWPKDGTTSLAALAFHGVLAAMLAVYLLFWTQWNLAETLPVVMALGVLLALTGHKALSGIATARFSSKKD